MRSNGTQRVRISSLVTCLAKFVSPNFNFNCSVGSKFSIRQYELVSSSLVYLLLSQCIFHYQVMSSSSRTILLIQHKSTQHDESFIHRGPLLFQISSGERNETISF